MDTTLLTSLIPPLLAISVVIVVAYLVTRSRIFPEIPRGYPTINVQILMVLKVV